MRCVLRDNNSIVLFLFILFMNAQHLRRFGSAWFSFSTGLHCRFQLYRYMHVVAFLLSSQGVNITIIIIIIKVIKFFTIKFVWPRLVTYKSHRWLLVTIHAIRHFLNILIFTLSSIFFIFDKDHNSYEQNVVLRINYVIRIKYELVF